MARRIHITGASGAGTTTPGQHLAREWNCAHFDTGDFYWLPTDPPFQAKREISERLRLLSAALHGDDWVLSGSLAGWGDPLIPLFTAVVYLEAPHEVCLARLRRREAQRYGAQNLEPGGPRYEQHVAFLAWAASYETGDRGGRSRMRHQGWLAALPCRVIAVCSDQPLERLYDAVRAEIAATSAASSRSDRTATDAPPQSSDALRSK
ncbi:MAG TPA: AAA family ATPase [Gemmatimonadales bacterium]|jgi:adenylate kinase family enzyme